jgi:hypothetical protein
LDGRECFDSAFVFIANPFSFDRPLISGPYDVTVIFGVFSTEFGLTVYV